MIRYLPLLLLPILLFYFWPSPPKEEEQIEAIAQTTTESDTFPTALFEEVMDLQAGEPLHSLNLAEATNKLLNTPWIKRAEVGIIPPNTLWVDYSLRQPIAYVKDLYNVAMDKEGYLFTVSPIYTAKKIPHIYFGNLLHLLGQPLTQPTRLSNHSLVIQILDKMHSLNLKNPTLIDLSKIEELSLGRREIALIFERWQESSPPYYAKHYLRLPCDGWQEALERYQRLQNHLQQRESSLLPSQNVETIVDLRVDEIGLVKLWTN